MLKPAPLIKALMARKDPLVAKAVKGKEELRAASYDRVFLTGANGQGGQTCAFRICKARTQDHRLLIAGEMSSLAIFKENYCGKVNFFRLENISRKWDREDAPYFYAEQILKSWDEDQRPVYLGSSQFLWDPVYSPSSGRVFSDIVLKTMELLSDSEAKKAKRAFQLGLIQMPLSFHQELKPVFFEKTREFGVGMTVFTPENARNKAIDKTEAKSRISIRLSGESPEVKDLPIGQGLAKVENSEPLLVQSV